jgi:hypothetical protein
MALSNDFNFSLNRDALIKRSMLMLGVISAAQTPTPNEVSAASNALNLMLKSWQADGMQLWQVNQISMTPTAVQAYPFGPTDTTNTAYRPTEVLEVYRRTTADEVYVPMIRLAREDFFTLSDHDSTGTPVNYYYNNDQTDGEMLVWPIANTNFIANNTIEVLLTKPFDDMDAAADSLAFPQEWELAVVYGLCVILAPEYGVPTTDQKMLIAQAEKEKQKVMDWDTEHVSIFFTPEPRFNDAKL